MKPRRLPRIPATVPNIFGPIPVAVRAFADETRGEYSHFDRVISINEALSLTEKWLTLWHERTHAELSEIGVEIAHDHLEAVCEAVARARVWEMMYATVNRAGRRSVK
jgi:hypothetical protein